MPSLRPPDDSAERREWERRVVLAEINKRRVNEAIEKGRHDDSDGAYVCECGHLGCNAILHLSARQYRMVRTGFDRFLIARGHEFPQVDEIDETHGAYAVAVKREGSGQLEDDGPDGAG
jgi:hypothetical protein